MDSLPERAYDDVAKLATTICGTPIAVVTLLDADRQWFKAKVGIDGEGHRAQRRSAHTRSCSQTTS